MNAQTNPAKDKVFLSYACADVAVCDQITTALEHAGIPCWGDAEDIEPGGKWLASLPSRWLTYTLVGAQLTLAG